MSSPTLDSYQLSFAISLICILLIPLSIAGIALINTGLGRSRSAGHAMTSALCVIGVAFIAYFVCGFAVQGHRDNLLFGGSKLPLEHTSIFLKGVAWGSPVPLMFLLGMFSAGLASVIPLGAAADRWRLRAACISTVVLAGFTFPLFSAFAWHAAGSLFNYGTGRFLDDGGSGTIHATGGLTALSIAWLLGPRRGKYSPAGMPAAIPAHNSVYVLFGCMLAWIGWLGLNSASALQYSALSALTVINTTLSAAAATLTAAVVTWIRYRRPDASLIANGWVAGLVASSAGCASLKPALALLTALVAGMLVVFSVEFLEFTLKVDDPCGSVSVHAVCGIWGLLAVGIFVGGPAQFLVQLAGVATLLGFILPLAYGLNWLLGRFIPHRVSIDGERQGLDLHELGADAYPEFVVHADEFMQR